MAADCCLMFLNVIRDTLNYEDDFSWLVQIFVGTYMMSDTVFAQQLIRLIVKKVISNPDPRQYTLLLKQITNDRDLQQYDVP